MQFEIEGFGVKLCKATERYNITILHEEEVDFEVF